MSGRKEHCRLTNVYLRVSLTVALLPSTAKDAVVDFLVILGLIFAGSSTTLKMDWPDGEDKPETRLRLQLLLLMLLHQ